MPEDAKLTRRDDTTAILRCLHELLREPAFATALALALSGKSQRKEDDVRNTMTQVGNPNEAFHST